MPTLKPLVPILFAGLTSCTWVPLEQEAAVISLLPANAVSACQLLGTTQSTSKAQLGMFDRKEEKLATELLTLARNTAVEMGGDSLVEQGPMENGKQTFAVYRCHQQ